METGMENKLGPQLAGSSLAGVAGWGIKTINLFEKYRHNHEQLSSYKKVLGTMIKFKEMYRPLYRGGKRVDLTGRLEEINEYRRLRRAEIYLNKRDLINTFDTAKGRRIVVTSRGRKIFYKDCPLARLRKKKWNGIWTVVMYDFPEKIRGKRDFFRRKLVGLGFGRAQISILVSPLPLEEEIRKLVEGEGLEDFIWVARAKKIVGTSDQEIARKAWPLEEIDILYGKLLESLNKAKQSEHLMDQWRSYFLAVNTSDPYLPGELLPPDWRGWACEKEFLKTDFLALARALFRPW
ncbi:hypothetical protein L6258_01465 [Candidatus Parcubacteria bacterium]|nr:hypothetical protein [Candidatus Parcubacteria bacterium]